MLAERRDDNEAAIVRALHQVGASVDRMPAGKGGIPDLLVGWCKKMFLLEVKAPFGPRGGGGGKLTPAQVAFRKRWKGPQLVTVRTPEEALRAIGALTTSQENR